jgi:hypothetical protein
LDAIIPPLLPDALAHAGERMKRARLAVTTVLVFGALLPALWPHVGDSNDLTAAPSIHIALVDAFGDGSLPANAADTEVTVQAISMSLNPFRFGDRNDPVAVQRTTESMAAWKADPTVKRVIAASGELNQRQSDRRPVIYARRNVALSLLLLAIAFTLLMAWKRLRRGSVKSGALLLTLGVAVVPFAIPHHYDDNYSVRGVSVPLFSMWTQSKAPDSQPPAPFPPAQAPAGEVWTPAAIDAARPLVEKNREALAQFLEVDRVLPELEGPSRLFWSAIGACFAILAAVAIRRRPQAELTTNPPTVIAAA